MTFNISLTKKTSGNFVTYTARTEYFGDKAEHYTQQGIEQGAEWFGNQMGERVVMVSGSCKLRYEGNDFTVEEMAQFEQGLQRLVERYEVVEDS